jgi:hypothetical protein
MNKKYLLGLLAIIPVILMIQTVDAEEKEFKVYEDGLTYKNIGGWGDVNIVIVLEDGQEIECYNHPWVYSGALAPYCVEIIMRSIP